MPGWLYFGNAMRNKSFYWRYRGKYRWGRNRWRADADSATLAHFIHKKRMRQRAMRILSQAGFVGTVPLVPIGGIESGVINNEGERAFPELDSPLGVIGKFIGELVHTYNATWEWTGTIWRQRF